MSDIERHLKHGARQDWDRQQEVAALLDDIPYAEWDGKFPEPSEVPWARLAAYAVIDDLRGRRGIRQEMDQIDDDVRVEIVEHLVAIIAAAYAAGLKEAA